MPTEDPDLVKARETAANTFSRFLHIVHGPAKERVKFLKAMTADNLRIQADVIDLYDETGMRSEQAQRLRVLADREEGSNN